MAYDTYNDLVASVADYLREDNLTSQIGDFIILFESVEGAKLVHPDGQTITTINISTSPANLPGDCGHVRMFGEQGKKPADQVSLEKLYDRDRQKVYAVTASSDADTTLQKLFLPTAPAIETTYDIVYRQKLLPLATSLNWLYRNFPMIYLYGTLLQAEPYLSKDDRIATWNALYQGALRALETSAKLIEQGAPIRSSTRVRTRV